MEYLISRFKYVSTIDHSELQEQWIEMLGIKIHKDTTYDFIEVPPLKEIQETLLPFPFDIKILTDCRFFTLLIGNLLKDSTKKSFFVIPRTFDCIEINIPDNCYYITLDVDIFIRNKQNPNSEPIYIANNVMGSDQGQWIIEVVNKKSFIEKSYLGIVEEGPLYLSLDGWIERYQKCVKKYLSDKSCEKNQIKKCYLGILSCLEKKHGIKVGVYKFKSCGSPINIINYNEKYNTNHIV